MLFHTKQPTEWIEQMKKRRPLNVVMVALANKMARIIWAVLRTPDRTRKIMSA
ncbi:Mobile element protein [Caballeronia sordidicola]|uniref:Mobile element protein n=1 Tax=Caballeronia sordidicola TaxID=196367 RepID=A0A226WXB8_CABSO|nr:Mobile element protein [Caballeronia sordidicola]